MVSERGRVLVKGVVEVAAEDGEPGKVRVTAECWR
jgi:hypothetical protein